ncbi:MAG: PDZ domain-containing protein [Pirellulales bacterium]|nr:PDZ domain-containing protein [Pirellulales bacterium]
MHYRYFFGTMITLYLAALACSAEKKDETTTPPPGSIAGAVPLEEGAKTEGVKNPDVKLDTVRPASYWLGVECGPLPKVLQMHLNLTERQGLLLSNVVLDGPAAKAGLVAGDILLTADGKKMESPADLLEVVSQADGKPIALELIHAGKPKNLRVAPEPRPQAAEEEPLPPALDEDWQQIQQWMQRMRPGGLPAANPPGPDLNALQFRFFGPGAILSQQGAAAAMALPGNLSISINKTGDQPARIVVQKGDQKWEVTEKELNKLPADIRPHVERMLSGVTIRSVPDVFNFGPHVAPPPAAARPPAKAPAMGPLNRQFQRQMEDMNRQMDAIRKKYDAEMRQHVEELQKQLDAMEKQEKHP